MALWVKCDFCAAHFATTGPTAAEKLVELSHEHQALRNTLEWVQRYADEVAWAGVLTLYAGVPIAHHLAPEFVYRYLVMIPGVGLPPRAPAHTHANGSAAATPEGEAFNPLAGLDLETVIRMAEGMGMTIPPEVLASMVNNGASETDPTESEAGITEPTPPEVSDTYTAAAESATGETAAPDAPDSDTGE
jgi:hypothetical protein